MPTIRFSCSACQTKIEVPASLAGRKGKCKGCGGPIQIPTPRGGSAPTPRPAPEQVPNDEPSQLDEEQVAAPAYDYDRGETVAGPKRGGFARPKPARKPREAAPNPVVSIVVGVLGVLGLIVGLFFIEVIIQGLRRGEGRNLSGAGVVIVFGWFYVGSVFGIARVLGLVLPRTTTAGRRSTVGLAVVALAAIVGAVAATRSLDEPPLIVGWIKSGLAGERGINDFKDVPAQANFAAFLPGLASPSLSVRRKSLFGICDLSLRQKLPSHEQLDTIRTSVRGLLARETDPDALKEVVWALACFGAEEDIVRLKALRDNKSREIPKNVDSAIDSINYRLKNNNTPAID